MILQVFFIVTIMTMYSQQHVRLYRTVKFLQLIFNLSHLMIKYGFHWKLESVSGMYVCIRNVSHLGLTFHGLIRTYFYI
jgi:hypothetical protein